MTETENRLFLHAVEANKNCAKIIAHILNAVAERSGEQEAFAMVQTKFPGVTHLTLARTLDAGRHFEQVGNEHFVELALELSSGITAAPLDFGKS